MARNRNRNRKSLPAEAPKTPVRRSQRRKPAQAGHGTKEEVSAGQASDVRDEAELKRRNEQDLVRRELKITDEHEWAYFLLVNGGTRFTRYLQGRERYLNKRNSNRPDALEATARIRDPLVKYFLDTQAEFYRRNRYKRKTFVNTMPSFKEEHILIVAPGSKTTLAQLGLPESFGPAAVRVPTRVFIDEHGRYTPNKIRAKRVKVRRPVATNGVPQTNGSGSAQGVPSGQDNNAVGSGNADVTAPTTEAALPVPGEIEEEITQYEEDIEEELGAIKPIVQGRIVDSEALRAILLHVDNLVSPPMHTPVLVVCDPAWSHADRESIAQFYFEHLQRPAVSFLNSPLAVCSGFGSVDGCIIDIGFEKTTISSVLGYGIVDNSITFVNGVGGSSINSALIQARMKAIDSNKIKGPAFDDSMVEQLKKQPFVCEILQPDVPLPVDARPEVAKPSNPAAAVSTGIDADKPAASSATSIGPVASAGLPQGPGPGTQTGTEGESNEADGVLDVASIVASGKASEILAKREQEKVEKAPRASNKKGGQEAAKPARLTNAQKPKVSFRYTERVTARDLHAAGNGEAGAAGATAMETAPADSVNGDGSKMQQANGDSHDDNDSYVYANREIEVGTERFEGCDVDKFLTPIALAVFDSINSAPPEKRQDLWNNLAIVGNGSKVKGLKERVLTHLLQSFLISPNNNTMFTSELPSHFSTPIATGANTPQPGFGGHGAATPTPGVNSSAVNPLLLAATTASQAQNQGAQLAPPGQPFQAPMQPSTPGGPGQMMGAGAPPVQLSLPHMPMHTPTSIKLMPPKDYFPEWKDHGFEEMLFLGACVQARVNFMMDSQQPANYLTRVQYNEEGPSGVHQHTLG